MEMEVELDSKTGEVRQVGMNVETVGSEHSGT